MDDIAAMLEPYDPGVDGRIEQTHQVEADDGTYEIDLVFIPGEHSVTPASVDTYLTHRYRDCSQEYESAAAVAEHLVGSAFDDLVATIDSPEYLGIRLAASTGRKQYTDDDIYHLETVTAVTDDEIDFLDEEGYM